LHCRPAPAIRAIRNDMKKLIPFLVLTVFATGAHAQGVVTFANHVLTTLSNPPYVYDGDGNRLTGTQWAAQLYYSPTDATSLTAHTAAPNRFRPAGDSLAGTWSTPTGANRTLTGGGPGDPVWMQIRVWNLDQFSTYEAALAGGGAAGTSVIFQYRQRAGTPGPSLTDTYMTDPAGNPLFASFGIPEPGVGLLMIPAVVLLLFMRRAKNTRCRRGRV
jgi:hypothetical protein